MCPAWSITGSYGTIAFYSLQEHECFENDIQKAQAKLLQLSRDKRFECACVCVGLQCVRVCTRACARVFVCDKGLPLHLSFLLDQLMRYEAVVLSGAEEETDYSSGDETLPPSSSLRPTETQVHVYTRP